MSIGLRAAQDWDEPPAGPRYSGAGDHAFARVIADPEARVTFSDVPAQLALVRLKLVAVRILPVQSVRSFCGLAHFGRRVWFYHELRASLSEADRAFWDQREPAIRAGLLAHGDVELDMARFRTRILPICHSAETVEELFTADTLEAQAEWLQRRWSTRRWRGLVALHPHARRLDRLLASTLASTSPLLQWALLGRHLDLERGPAWLTTAGHKALRGGWERVGVAAR